MRFGKCLVSVYADLVQFGGVIHWLLAIYFKLSKFDIEKISINSVLFVLISSPSSSVHGFSTFSLPQKTSRSRPCCDENHGHGGH